MTQTRTIVITEFDLQRLKELIDKEKYSGLDVTRRRDLKELEAELARGEVVKPSELPGDIITMNSTVELLDIDTGEELTITLVFPQEADFEQNKISVLAPIGIGMIGYRVGDNFTWPIPRGERRLEVKAIIYQPEAAGDYHL